MHVYVIACAGAHACAFAGVGQRIRGLCVRACEFICMYDYYIILLYISGRVVCAYVCAYAYVRTSMQMLAYVRTRVCTRMRSCGGAHARVCVCISVCTCVARVLVCALASVGLHMCLSRHVRAHVGAHACALAGAGERACWYACERASVRACERASVRVYMPV